MVEFSNKSIGVFDSGVGGLTVLKELMHTLPNENFIYFGDTARLPYGNKSAETITRYSIENSIFLLEKDVKMIVVACNTATAHSLKTLQKLFNVPILGVIEAAAECAYHVSKKKRIAILGTRGTILSESYQQAILRHSDAVEIAAIPCPLLAPLVEEHYLEHPATRLILEEYLGFVSKYTMDTIVLGCTHYPLLRKMIESIVGPTVAIVDPAITCAKHVAAVLISKQLENKATATASHQFFASDAPEKMHALAEQFLGMPIKQICDARF